MTEKRIEAWAIVPGKGRCPFAIVGVDAMEDRERAEIELLRQANIRGWGFESILHMEQRGYRVVRVKIEVEDER